MSKKPQIRTIYTILEETWIDGAKTLDTPTKSNRMKVWHVSC
jgi:hypothetical protein